ncbi:MAG: YbjN domain-containing protein [Deltaproteobacteria bacterium]|nr:YbjN domain-containing protein [Deltaproteobacteria bacterium]
MALPEDIEGYLIRMGVSYEELAKSTWMIHDEYEQIDNIVVSLNDPVVYFRVKLMDVPKGCNRESLYETLLTLNTTDMMHGAYGLENDTVIATDTLQAENLDFNEFQASVDSLSLCISSHYQGKLGEFHRAASAAAAK